MMGPAMVHLLILVLKTRTNGAGLLAAIAVQISLVAQTARMIHVPRRDIVCAVKRMVVAAVVRYLAILATYVEAILF